MTARPDRGAAGFTLIELLVALTLFGLISIVVMGGLRFGTRVWETGGTRAEASDEVEAVQDILRSFISQAMVPQPFGAEAADAPLFVGDHERLRFITVTPAHIGVGGLYQVEIWWAEGRGDDEGTLQLAWHLYRPDDPRAIESLSGQEDTLAGGRRTLLTGVKSVAFSYVDPEELVFGNLEWEDTWSESDLLPGLIAMKVEFAGDPPRPWPDFVVRTRIARGSR